MTHFKWVKVKKIKIKPTALTEKQNWISIIVYQWKEMLLERRCTIGRGSGLAMPSCSDVGLFSHIYNHAHTQTYTDWHMVTHMHACIHTSTIRTNRQI